MSEQAAAPDPAQPAPPGEAPTGASPDGSRGEARRRLRPLRWLFGLLGTLLILVLLLVLFVLGTQTGLRTAIAVAEELVPGMVSVGNADGRVLGRLHLENVELHVPNLDLRLGSLDLNWAPLAALIGKLSIAELAVRDIDVVTTPAPEENAPGPIALPELVLPIRVEIDRALVERLRVSQVGAEEPSFELDRAALSASLADGKLQLASLDVALPNPSLTAQAQGQAQLTGQYPLDLSLDWDLALDPGAQVQGRGRLEGDLGELLIEHRITGAADLSIDGRLRNVLDRPSWDAAASIERVDLPAFKSDLPKVDISGRVETQGNLDEARVTASVEAKAPDLPDFGHLSVAADALWKDKVLELSRLDLREDVLEAQLTAQGRLDLNPEPGSFQVQADWQRLRWPLSGDLVADSPRGRLEAFGTFDDYAYKLETEARGPGIPTTGLDLTGSGDPQGTRISALKVSTLDGTATAAGELSWAPQIAWDLKVDGEDLNPGRMVEGLEDRIAFSLTTKGGPDAYTYGLDAATRGPGLPPAKLALSGDGDLKGARVDRLRLDALDGRIEGRTTATWDPRIGWDAELTATDLNPGTYAPDWPGRIGGRIASRGELGPEGPDLTAVIDSVEGELRGYPVSATGQLSMQGKTVRVDALRAASGPSVARIDGTVADNLDLTFDVSSPDLGSLAPGAKGSVQAKGNVRGTLEAPLLELELAAKDAEIAGQRIASLSGTADVGLSRDGRFDIRLDGGGIHAGGLALDSLTVRGDGSMPDHRLSASASGKQLAFDLDGSGGLLQDGGYEGRLARLELTSDQFGAWRMQKPMPVAVAPPKLSVGPLCIRNGEGSGGCIQVDQSAADRWVANIDLDQLGFDLLKPFLPENLVAEGAARIKGHFEAAGRVLTGDARAEIPSGLVRIMAAGGKQQVLDFSSTSLKLNAGADGVSGRLDLPIEGLGAVDANLALPGWRLDDPARPGQPLRGGLRAQISNLSPIADLVPDLTAVTGAIDADLSLGGTFAKPGLNGQAGIRNVAADVPLIGLKITNMNINAVAPSLDRLDVQGQADLNGGRFELAGSSRFGSGGFTAQLRAGGEKLKVADTKEYFVVMSPKIDVEADSKGARVRGEIRVPEARIRPRSLPAGTVSPSPDVVLGKTEPAPPYPVEVDMRLLLGDKVTIDAFGVRGRLTGDLRVTQAPGKEMLGDGQLAIVDGFYRMTTGFGIAAELGAPLTIEQGRLIYAKSPIGNPGLLLRAKREGGDTTAGVQVLGTIRNPKLAFFSDSDPAMSQADVTKYLLTGVPPKKDEGSENRSLSLGTYVAPKLYMEYENGLGDQKDKVKLRYDLSRWFELQTETGESQGADIFYKFEN